MAPRTLARSSDRLAIQLSGSQASYRPGDTIAGCVVRRAFTEEPSAQVFVQLLGRAESEVDDRDGHLEAHHEGRFNFFGPDENREVLHDGYLYIGASRTESALWPFSITIPTRPSPDAVIADHREQQSYLPLQRTKVAGQTLPGSFLFTRHIPSKRVMVQGYVEYYLEATFRWGPSYRETATQPIFISVSSTRQPLPMYAINWHREIREAIRSYRLLPGRASSDGSAGSSLSYSERTHRFFRTSKVPRLSLAVSVGLPSVIQLQNRTPFPFVIRLVPCPDTTSSSLSRVPVPITVASVALQLLDTTEIKCKASMLSGGSPDPRATQQTLQADFDLDRHFDLRVVNKPVLTVVVQDPASGASRSGEDQGHAEATDSATTAATSIDLGAMLQLGIDSTLGPTVRGKPVRDGQHQRQAIRVTPSFTTYNIRHSHQFQWRVTLSVGGGEETGGETVRLTGRRDVDVLGPSEEQLEQEAAGLDGEEARRKKHDALLAAADVLGALKAGVEAADHFNDLVELSTALS